MEGVHLAGLTSPRPVLTLRIEATSSSEQSRLSAALALLTVEDPSLVVKETPTNTLISGLGELHMEVVLDRLRREFGLEVRTGKPAVAYRETVLFEGDGVETDGLVEYDRTVGGVQLQGAVRLRLSPSTMMNSELCVPPEDPLVTLSPQTREFFKELQQMAIITGQYYPDIDRSFKVVWQENTAFALARATTNCACDAASTHKERHSQDTAFNVG